MAVISASPAAAAAERSTRKEIQLGRNEYCIAVMAESPLYINSMDSAATGFTQPVPVVPATTRIRRSQALVRSSLSRISLTRAAVSGADCNPA